MEREAYYVAQTAYATWGLIGVTFFLAGGTVYFMRRQVRDAKQALQVQLFIQLGQRYENASLIQARSQVSNSLRAGSSLNHFFTQSLLDFFETLGYLTRSGHLDARMVFNEYSVGLSCYWTALSTYVEQARKQYLDEDLYANAGWLYVANSKHEKARTGAPNAAVIAAFLKSEMN